LLKDFYQQPKFIDNFRWIFGIDNYQQVLMINGDFCNVDKSLVTFYLLIEFYDYW